MEQGVVVVVVVVAVVFVLSKNAKRQVKENSRVQDRKRQKKQRFGLELFRIPTQAVPRQGILFGRRFIILVGILLSLKQKQTFVSR